MHSVLITGGTGTLGQAIVKRLMSGTCPRIIVLSRDEFKQMEMRDAIPDPEKRLRYFVGDVRDLSRLKLAFAGVEYVIHAAALKQVDAMEFNPLEAIYTNVRGSEHVIQAALDCEVRRTLLISTDKADAPTTLYGATKLCAERLFTASNYYAGGRDIAFSYVRFGNLAFSRGSVIPRWRGKKVVPVTDPECTRYWITPDDAAAYSIAALFEALPPLPQMSAYRLGDLAEAMNAQMQIIGLRPGERLHEMGSEHAPRLTIGELRGLITGIDDTAARDDHARLSRAHVAGQSSVYDVGKEI